MTPNIPYRLSEESYDDFFVRLHENKRAYSLSSQQIADILNKETGKQYTESKYRKEFKTFQRGRLYERKRSDRDIATRILSISDFHVPYQLPPQTFSAYKDINILQVNGDVLDMQAISKFPKPFRISPMEEMIAARSYLIDLITLLRPAKLVVNYGNHDLRFQDYLMKAIDPGLYELLPKTALEMILLSGFWQYDKRSGTKRWFPPIQKVVKNTEIVFNDSWFCLIGDALFCHPSAFSGGILKTAEKAMQYFRNEGYSFRCLIMAHTHRIGSYVIGNTIIYEQGCCCDTKQLRYSDGKLVLSQKEGFISICQDKNGITLRNRTQQNYLN